MPRALLALALVGCATGGCVTGGKAPSPFERGLWPIFSADARPWAGVREGRALGPFVHWETVEGEQRFELRPLLSRRRRPDLTRWDLLYPLAATRATPERRQTWLLWMGRGRADRDGASDSGFGAAFRGQTADGQSYRGVFPLLGSFRGRFGFDRIRFWMWPLFAQGDRGSYRETQILWPFLSFGRGGGHFKLRLWPLFGIEREAGRYDHRFLLWPFVHWWRERLDSDSPEHALWILPLYGRRDRGAQHTRAWLFPLLAYQWNDRDASARRLDLLWPLFSRAHERGRSLLAVQPFYVERRDGQSRLRSFGLGALSRYVRSGEDSEEREWRVLWVSRFGWRRDERGERTRADLWPLFRRTSLRPAKGPERGTLRVPWLLPLHGLEPDGWRRHWNALFELYEARWLGEQRRSSWVFGLRETRSAPGVHFEQWAGWLRFQSLEESDVRVALRAARGALRAVAPQDGGD